MYGTNTIHTESQDVLRNLHGILLPQHRAAIRSAELRWVFAARDDRKPAKENKQRRTWELRHFKRFCAQMPGLLPNASSIYLSFQGNMTDVLSSVLEPAPVDRPDWTERGRQLAARVFAATDQVAQRLGPHVDEFCIALSSSLYRQCREAAEKAGDVVVEYEHLGQQERLWRPLDGGVGADPKRRGYWVYLGERDFRRVYMCSMGEAPGGTNPVQDDVFYQRI